MEPLKRKNIYIIRILSYLRLICVTDFSLTDKLTCLVRELLIVLLPPQHLQLQVSLEHVLLHGVARLAGRQLVLQHPHPRPDTLLPRLPVLLVLSLLLLLLRQLSPLGLQRHLPDADGLLGLLGSGYEALEMDGDRSVGLRFTVM